MGYYLYFEALEDIKFPGTDIIAVPKGKIAQWHGIGMGYNYIDSEGETTKYLLEYHDKRIRIEQIHAPATLQDVANVFDADINNIDDEEMK